MYVTFFLALVWEKNTEKLDIQIEEVWRQMKVSCLWETLWKIEHVNGTLCAACDNLHQKLEIIRLILNLKTCVKPIGESETYKESLLETIKEN